LGGGWGGGRGSSQKVLGVFAKRHQHRISASSRRN
jgi:hypothetical protein